MYTTQGSSNRHRYGGGDSSVSGGQPTLHHPVPQHPIPPIKTPASINTNSNYSNSQFSAASNPYIPQKKHDHHDGPLNEAHGSGQYGNYADGGGDAGFGNIFNDQRAQMGFQVGRSAVLAGSEALEKSLNQYVSVSAIRYYFQVSNGYVIKKIGLILFPWRHKHWTRTLTRNETPTGAVEGYETAKEDINAPDLYIPVMACTTYILLSSLLSGLGGTFHPQKFGYFASKAFAFAFFELMIIKLGSYLLATQSPFLDFIAYSGYKFVGIIVNMIFGSFLFSSSITARWGIFFYTFGANAFFLLRSLKYVVLPDNIASGTAHTLTSGQRQRRIQFLFVYSFFIQFALMWFLS